MTVKNFMDQNAKNLIRKMENQFDSHRFIIQLSKDYEKDYVVLLNTYIESLEIFRTLHAQIGRYLTMNQDKLSITKIKRSDSDNIKDNESENQIWGKKIVSE
jgi:hypothetical protein